jgi:NADH:ubiquinone reductase (H+-translocating)
MASKVAIQRSRVVIIGAAFGGLSAAKALAGGPFDVTLVDRYNYHLYQPLLYQVATAALSPADIASPIRTVFRRPAHLIADGRHRLEPFELRSDVL